MLRIICLMYDGSEGCNNLANGDNDIWSNVLCIFSVGNVVEFSLIAKSIIYICK